MLNEIQVKMLDKGWWPNRVWMSLASQGKCDVKVPYVNRATRRAAKRNRFNGATHTRQFIPTGIGVDSKDNPVIRLKRTIRHLKNVVIS